MGIDLVHVGVMFTFDTKSKTTRTRFYRKLYGFKDVSHFGKYHYEREGLLTNIPYLKPTNSTIIVRIRDALLLRKFFKKYNVRFSEHIGFLTIKEAKTLKIANPKKWQEILEDLKGSRDLLVTVDF